MQEKYVLQLLFWLSRQKWVLNPYAILASGFPVLILLFLQPIHIISIETSRFSSVVVLPSPEHWPWLFPQQSNSSVLTKHPEAGGAQCVWSRPCTKRHSCGLFSFWLILAVVRSTHGGLFHISSGSSLEQLINTFLSPISLPNQAEMFRISPRRPGLLFFVHSTPCSGRAMHAPLRRGYPGLWRGTLTAPPPPLNWHFPMYHHLIFSKTFCSFTRSFTH